MDSAIQAIEFCTQLNLNINQNDFYIPFWSIDKTCLFTPNKVPSSCYFMAQKNLSRISWNEIKCTASIHLIRLDCSYCTSFNETKGTLFTTSTISFRPEDKAKDVLRIQIFLILRLLYRRTSFVPKFISSWKLSKSLICTA